MGKIYEIQLIATSLISAYVSLVLLFISSQNRLLNKLLGFYSLTISIFCFLSYAISLKWAPDFVVLIRTFLPLYYFLPAIGYLYFRSYLEDATSLRKKDLIHIVPIFLHFIYISPLIYALITKKVLWGDLIAKVDQQSYFINYGSIPDQFHVFFRLSLMVIYIFLGWKCYFSKTYREFIKKNINNYLSAKRWIFFYFLGISCIGFISMIIKSRIFFLHDKHSWANGNLITISLILGYDLLFAYAVLHPEILFGMPHFKKLMSVTSNELSTETISYFKLTKPAQNRSDTNGNEIQAQQIDEQIHNDILFDSNEKIDQKDDTAASVVLTEEIIGLIAHVKQYISSNQPYRKEKFNIESISKDLDVPQHHIAYLFKHILKKSFVDYRNELRVNHVIESIRKGLHHEVTMESLGTDAGFGSKVSFFTVFKKVTGQTPKQYAEKLNEI